MYGIHLTLTLVVILFFGTLSYAQNEKAKDHAGQLIEELISKQKAITYNAQTAPSKRSVITYDEYGFELFLPSRPKVLDLEKETVYRGKIGAIEITVFNPVAEQTQKVTLGSWLNTNSYRHTPFPITNYRDGLIAQCYTLSSYYKVGIVQEFQKKNIVFALSLPKDQVAQNYEKIQQILNGFSKRNVTTSPVEKNPEIKKEPSKTETSAIDLLIAEDQEERDWTPPTPEEIEKRISSLPPGTEQDKMLYLGHTTPSEVRLYMKILGETKAPFQLRGEEKGYVGNFMAFLVLLEACHAIAQKQFSLQDSLILNAQDKLLSSSISAKPEGSALEIQMLLEAMVASNDQTATELMGKKMGWDKILSHAEEIGVSPKDNLFPIRFKHLVYADLVPILQKKTIESKIENWNLYSESRKERVIKEAFEKNQNSTYEQLRKANQNFLSPLTSEQKHLLAQTFGLKASPSSLVKLLESLLKNEYRDEETSKLVQSYLEKNFKNLWFSPFPEGTQGGVFVGTDLGISSAFGYAKLPKGKTLIFCYLSDNLKEENAITKLKNNVYFIFYLASRFYNQ